MFRTQGYGNYALSGGVCIRLFMWTFARQRHEDLLAAADRRRLANSFEGPSGAFSARDSFGQVVPEQSDTNRLSARPPSLRCDPFRRRCAAASLVRVNAHPQERVTR